MKRLAFLPAHQLVSMLRNRTISSEELVEVYLDKIAKYNDHLRQFSDDF